MADDKTKEGMYNLRSSKRLRAKEDERKQEGKKTRIVIQENLEVGDHGDDKQKESRRLRGEEETLQDPSNKEDNLRKLDEHVAGKKASHVAKKKEHRGNEDNLNEMLKKMLKKTDSIEK